MGIIIIGDDQKKVEEKYRGLLNQTEFEVAVSGFIKKHFKDWWHFRVAEETRIYSWRENEEIWKQKRGEKPLIVEVYYQDEYLCDITSKTQPDEAYNLIIQKIMALVAKQAKEDKQKEDKQNESILI